MNLLWKIKVKIKLIIKTVNLFNFKDNDIKIFDSLID